MIDVSLPSMANIEKATGKQLREISEYLQQLSEQLRYELSHVDETNMTAETIEQINKTADNTSSMSLQQFCAGLHLEFAGTTLRLMSNNIEMNAVGLSALRADLVSADGAFEALYPIGTIYTTANTTDDITEILPFGASWQDITPEGVTDYKQYKRIEEE